MPDNEKKGITVKIDAGLHAEVRQYLESHGMTMAEFVSQALRDELHPKINVREDRNMGNMRTLAFQVPEELFQRIKEHLQRTGMTQKDFMLGLIEKELNQHLAQLVETVEAIEESAEYAEEQDIPDISEDLDEVNEESEDIDEDESEYMGMGMSM